ncbi:MAG: hypothetical protein GTO14_04790 [Anaerolineales bacterium]|nr:hypothetical protein [Deltaproteobacteria bacterium]NIS79522.1 hypothetical protein [Anaerolineales bacterium]
MRKVYVIGVGMTEFGEHTAAKLELFVEAAQEALAGDAPIGVAIIELADGHRILRRLLDAGQEYVRVGMEVKGIKPVEVEGRVAVGFVPLSHKNEH